MCARIPKIAPHTQGYPSSLSKSAPPCNETLQMPPANETYLYTPCPPQPGAIRLGWAYPYTYSVAMASLGYLALFRQMDERPDVDAVRLNNENIHQHDVQAMDLLGFSFSFELDILEVLKMLDTAGLPRRASARDDKAPLVFAGGPVVITNPEPYADFFDFFLIGEGEELLNDLMTAMKALSPSATRHEKLLTLAQSVPGVYVPGFYTVSYSPQGQISAITPNQPQVPFPVQKRVAGNLDDWMTASPILTEDSVFSKTYMVEVMRGCPHRCRFCLASYSMLTLGLEGPGAGKAVRGPSLDAIIARIEEGRAHTSKIGLVGALIAEHPQFEALCEYLSSIDGLEVTAASFRADTITEAVARTFQKGGQRTLTIAVESGSEAIRRRINKHLKTEDIYQAAEIIARVGIPTLKLYFMVGLPGETMADLDDTIALVQGIKKANPRLKLVVGCSTFVPKAATPFQWQGREGASSLQKKQEYLRKHLARISDFRPSSPKWDYVQALFSRGDRRLSGWIEAFLEAGGKLGAVNRASKHLRDMGVNVPDLEAVALSPRPQSDILPWDTLFLGVDKATLWREGNDR